MESANPERLQTKKMPYFGHFEIIMFDKGCYYYMQDIYADCLFETEEELHAHMGQKMRKFDMFDEGNWLSDGVKRDIWDKYVPKKEPVFCESCGKEEIDDEDEADPYFKDLFDHWTPSTLQEINELIRANFKDGADCLVRYSVQTFAPGNKYVKTMMYKDGK
ncbi:hypothetical protein [Sicyoidochytrium minutum DNA virus]|nr:hypothetical protein [Sicyoidochytrium minutum DNA virus]